MVVTNRDDEQIWVLRSSGPGKQLSQGLVEADGLSGLHGLIS